MLKSIVRNVVVGRFLIQRVYVYCVAATTPNKVNVPSGGCQKLHVPELRCLI